jgi:probable phosphoglycerate mutase
MHRMSGCSNAPAGRLTGTMLLRRLWLVRNAESTWDQAGLVQGHHDPPLSDRGREQAARCARHIAANLRPEAIYASDLRRALETAAPIAELLDLEVHVEPALRERSLGDAEGTPSRLLGADRSGIDGGRVVDADAAPPGGESVRQLYERAVSCAARLLSAHRGDLVLVCHGGIVRVLLGWFRGEALDEFEWSHIENGVPILTSTIATVLDRGIPDMGRGGR